VIVKTHLIIAFIGTLIVTTGCPGSSYNNNLKDLQKNNMDFPNLRKEYYNGIHFMLGEMFVNDYEDNYTLNDNALTKVVYELDVNFSTEVFNQSDAETIRYAFDTDIESLDAVHDNYIIQRQKSLYEHSTSIKKELPKSVPFKGSIQVVHGGSYSTNTPSTYFIATVEIDNTFYVFQLIGKKDNMGYLYDDFIDLLSSIEK
jgi:hypothetical protein